MALWPLYRAFVARVWPARNSVRSRLRRILAFLGLGVAGFVGLAASGTVLLARAMTAAINRFLAEVTSPDPAPARRDAGPKLQRAIDEAGLRRWVADHGRQGDKVNFWSNRSRNNSGSVLEGTMTLRDGSTVPLRLVVRQNAAGVRQVIGLSVDEGGGSATAARS